MAPFSVISIFHAIIASPSRLVWVVLKIASSMLLHAVFPLVVLDKKKNPPPKTPPAEHVREIIDAESIFFANQCRLAEKGEKVD